MEADNMATEFKAVLIAILDYLENGEVERAIAYIREILDR